MKTQWWQLNAMVQAVSNVAVITLQKEKLPRVLRNAVKVYILQKDFTFNSSGSRRLHRVAQVKLSPCRNIQTLGFESSADRKTRISNNSTATPLTKPISQGSIPAWLSTKKPSFYTWLSLILTPLGLSFCSFALRSFWLLTGAVPRP